MQDRNSRRSAAFGGGQIRVFGVAAVLGLAALSGVVRATERFAPDTAEGAQELAAGLAEAPELAEAPVLEEALASAAVWDLPNLDHERVDYFVQMFSGRKRQEFSRFLTRMGHYQPMISRKLEERGMPQDLIYLAMIESGFNPLAYSHAHASGMWQFISATGQRYGLEINRAVDERRDPEKATDAALSYLEDLYGQFGSWYLAAAAYNSGEGRVARIMRQVTGSVKGDEYSYYRIRSRLPRETRDYVPLMVAAARIAKEPEKYGFADVAPGAPLEYDVVTVGPATQLSAVALAAGTTVAEIRRLNPELKLNRTRNDRADSIRVPAGAAAAFEERFASVKPQAPAPRVAQTQTYRIRRGDTLTHIARRHGTTVSALKRANGLRGDRIRAGTTLRIPSSG